MKDLRARRAMRASLVVLCLSEVSPRVGEGQPDDLKKGGVLKLNGPIVSGGNVVNFVVGPRGNYVVYRADQGTDEVRDIYRSKLTNGVLLNLNSPLVDGEDVGLN